MVVDWLPSASCLVGVRPETVPLSAIGWPSNGSSTRLRADNGCRTRSAMPSRNSGVWPITIRPRSTSRAPCVRAKTSWPSPLRSARGFPRRAAVLPMSANCKVCVGEESEPRSTWSKCVASAGGTTCGNRSRSAALKPLRADGAPETPTQRVAAHLQSTPRASHSTVLLG